MLRELHELSENFELSWVGYDSSTAIWQVDLSLPIPVVSLLETSSRSGKGKPKPGKKLVLPSLRRNADEPILIDDAAEYVFGIGSRGTTRHPLYLDLLTQCIQETQDEGAKRVLAYIESCDIEALDRDLNQKLPPPTDKQGNPKPREPFWWAKDRFSFVLDGELISHRPSIRRFWSAYYARKQETVEAVCLLTGEVRSTISKKMPAMVKGVPNTQSSGAAITSFDKAAYQSYGWEGNANAPIGFEPAVQIHKMLEVLLQKDSHHIRFGNQVFVFWVNQNAEGLVPEFWDDPAAGVAKGIFETPNKPGDLPGGIRVLSRRFYLATLKGNKGRIALSNWSECDPEQVKVYVQRFVDCQKLVESERPKPIWLLRNCAFKDPKKEHTDRIEIALVKAALFGEPLPEEYALKVINRICQEQDVMRSLDRAKALAFYLESRMEKLTHDRIAYVLGRIAFLMHWAQKTAQNLSREETNVSRSLRTLSLTPALMFPRLYQGCITNHLEDRDALKDKKRSGILINLKRRLEREFNALGDYDPDRDLPEIFTVRQQTQFFIGFAKCRAEYFGSKEKTANSSEDE